MRLPRNTVKKIADKLGFSSAYVCGVIGKNEYLSESQAERFAIACSELNMPVPKELWLSGPPIAIKNALLGEINKSN